MKQYLQALIIPMTIFIITQAVGRILILPASMSSALSVINAVQILIVVWAGWRTAHLSDRWLRCLLRSIFAGPLIMLPSVLILGAAHFFAHRDAITIVGLTGSYLLIGCPLFGMGSLLGGILSLWLGKQMSGARS